MPPSSHGAGGRRSDLCAIAREAAAEATAVLRSAWLDKAPVEHRGTEKGIVTEFDLTAESLIREVILTLRPKDGFLGEELDAIRGTSGVEWVVDPLDGTNNFVAGLPGWAVSIAARVEGRVVLGLVEMPARGDVYTACAGFGAWRNGERLWAAPGRAFELGEAVVATGFSSSEELRRVQLEQLGRVLARARDVRCLGAASIELCALAAAEGDAYYESGLSLWDVAAAGLIATEAGLVVSGSPFDATRGTLVAAAPRLAGSLRGVVDVQCG